MNMIGRITSPMTPPINMLYIRIRTIPITILTAA